MKLTEIHEFLDAYCEEKLGEYGVLTTPFNVSAQLAQTDKDVLYILNSGMFKNRIFRQPKFEIRTYIDSEQVLSMIYLMDDDFYSYDADEEIPEISLAMIEIGKDNTMVFLVSLLRELEYYISGERIKL